MQKKESEFKDINVKYSDIAKDIAGKNDLKYDNKTIDDTEKVHTKKIKRKENESDYALLKRLAEEIDYEFFVRADKLYFRKPQDDKNKNDDTFIFQYRKNFISFSPRLTTAPTVNEVKVTGWSKKSKESITATANISDIKTSIGIPHFEKIVEDSEGKKIEIKLEGRVVESEDDAKRLAVSELKRANNGFIEGTLECIGNPDLRPGMNIEIAKVGKRWFSGMYYIKGSKHSIGDSGYTTTLDVRRCL